MNEKYMKIKDSLSRCGNKIIEINSKDDVKKLLFDSLNYKKQNRAEC